jgi:hypothetical protein
MTYGQIRLRLSQMAAGVPIELLDGWLQDRYTQMLDELPWKRLEGEIVLQSPPSYQVGTVTATQGSASIVGAGTVWTPAMTGLMIRIACGQEFYTFTYVSAEGATLDRPYEGSTSSITGSAIGAAGTGYQPGDTFWITGGDSLAMGIVETIGAGGAVATYALSNNGNLYTVQNGVATTTSGLGVGFTLDITTVGASSGLSYRIDQNIFVLPVEARVLRGVRSFHPQRDLDIISPGELNRIAPGRLVYGTPRYAVQTWDATTNPPQLQLELYPVPSSPDGLGNTLSFAADCIFDPDAIDPTQTTVSLLPWARPAALINGVQADIAKWQKDWQGAAVFKTDFKELLKQMAQINALQRGPMAMNLAPELKGRGAGFGLHRRKHQDRDYFGEDEN